MISGCLPYVLVGTGGAMLTVIFLVSTACLSQHQSMMVQNGMTRYKNDLVRRKDKVKARKADNKTPIKYEKSSHLNHMYHVPFSG
jgi:hypothetical protein